MNRRRAGVIATLLILFAVLITSWVNIYDVHLPFGEWGRPSDGPRHKVGEVNPDKDAHFTDAPAPEDSITRGNRPLEIVDEPRIVATPPEPMEIPDTAGDLDTGRREQVVAELRAGEPGVSGANADFDLQPFIVSTLVKYPTEVDKGVTGLFGGSALIKLSDSFSDGNYEQLLNPAFDYLLQGKVNFPALAETDRSRLDAADRLQAWVYLPELPDFYCVVTPENNTFVLRLMDSQVKRYRQKGLTVCVHSPAFRVAGGGESITLTKVSEQTPEINLEFAPVFKLVVRVTPQGAVDDGVRVWVERRGVECPIDDSIYMSANVPPSGELVFHVPEHYGELRLAVTGADWHSGLPQLVRFDDWSKTVSNVSLTCTPEPCDRITGAIGRQVKSTASENEFEFQGGGVARIEDTAFGTVVYSRPDGAFDCLFPYTLTTPNRQLIISSRGYAPIGVALDRGLGDQNSVVITNNGRSPYGPWQITRSRIVGVDVTVPELENESRTFAVDGRVSLSREVNQVFWGSRLIEVLKGAGGQVVASYWISDDAWEDALREQAKGRTPVKLKLMTLEKYLERQVR
ncbi:MAG: hypothetical protein KDB68_00235 [Planctomycetes bacterium]|nr:hypothetical protein [Planctomycetota bacterium]